MISGLKIFYDEVKNHFIFILGVSATTLHSLRYSRGSTDIFNDVMIYDTPDPASLLSLYNYRLTQSHNIQLLLHRLCTDFGSFLFYCVILVAKPTGFFSISLFRLSFYDFHFHMYISATIVNEWPMFLRTATHSCGVCILDPEDRRCKNVLAYVIIHVAYI